MKIDRNSVVLLIIGALAAMVIIATAYESCAPDYREWSRSTSHVMTAEEVRQDNERRDQSQREADESYRRIEASRKFEADRNKLLKDLVSHPPSVKSSDPPYIKGKGFTTGSKYSYLNEDELANGIEEVQTIVRVDCKKADLLGQYNFFTTIPGINGKIPTGRKVPVYTNKCLVTIIDYTIPAVIARKSFENSDAPEEKDFTTEYVGNEYICPEPRNEIAAFIKNLARK